jgi:hypothetical protein
MSIIITPKNTTNEIFNAFKYLAVSVGDRAESPSTYLKIQYEKENNIFIATNGFAYNKVIDRAGKLITALTVLEKFDVDKVLFFRVLSVKVNEVILTPMTESSTDFPNWRRVTPILEEYSTGIDSLKIVKNIPSQAFSKVWDIEHLQFFFGSIGIQIKGKLLEPLTLINGLSWNVYVSNEDDYAKKAVMFEGTSIGDNYTYTTVAMPIYSDTVRQAVKEFLEGSKVKEE